MPDELDLSTDEALISAISEHPLEELKLEPFSLLRQSVATDLCDVGRGSFFNAVMTVWVCTLRPKEALEAHADAIAAKIRAFEWAEGRGYSLVSCEPLIAAYKRLNDEWAAIAKVHLKPGSNGDAPDPNAGGQHT
jgi:hypothetical protein